MNIIQRISVITALCLAAVGGSSCTIVDTGGAVNNVGRYIPVDENLANPSQTHEEISYTVHTYQDTAYLEIPVRYLPARNKWFHCWMIGGGYVEENRRFESFSRPDKHPLDGIYYALIPVDRLQSRDALRHVTHLIPACSAEPFPAGTSTGTIQLPNSAQRALSKLEDDCTWANYAVQPLHYVAELADIPLSVMATPVNWCVMLFGDELWRY